MTGGRVFREEAETKTSNVVTGGQTGPIFGDGEETGKGVNFLV